MLELGTGTGHGTAWLLSGMDSNSSLDTVDNDQSVVAVARRHLSSDVRVAFHVTDGAEFIQRAPKGTLRFDRLRGCGLANVTSSIEAAWRWSVLAEST